jgi:hypothetical protein
MGFSPRPALPPPSLSEGLQAGTKPQANVSLREAGGENVAGPFSRCGKYSKRKGAGDFKVLSIADLNNIIVPFFLEYQLQGVKDFR